MKIGNWKPAAASWQLGFMILFSAFGFAALAQPYSIDWYTIAGGGGTSTGGGFSISGTIGQHDASGPMTGGNYSLTGGFWSLLSVAETAGAPRLSIFITATNTAVVTWPSTSAGWNLQQNPSLGTPNWTAPSETVNDNGTNKFIVVNPPTGSRFYRLSNP